MTQQMEMFDKAVAEMRVVQVVDNKTGQALNWSLEFRFTGEDKWHPVKVQTFGIDLEETIDESAAGN